MSRKNRSSEGTPIPARPSRFDTELAELYERFEEHNMISIAETGHPADWMQWLMSKPSFPGREKWIALAGKFLDAARNARDAERERLDAIRIYRTGGHDAAISIFYHVLSRLDDFKNAMSALIAHEKAEQSYWQSLRAIDDRERRGPSRVRWPVFQ